MIEACICGARLDEFGKCPVCDDEPDWEDKEDDVDQTQTKEN